MLCPYATEAILRKDVYTHVYKLTECKATSYACAMAIDVFIDPDDEATPFLIESFGDTFVWSALEELNELSNTDADHYDPAMNAALIEYARQYG